MIEQYPVSECPACSRQSSQPVSQHCFQYSTRGTYKYTLWCCHTCGLHWIVPLPMPDVITYLYPPEYRAMQNSEESVVYSYSDVKLWLASARQSHKFIPQAIAVVVECVTGRTIPLSLSIPLQLETNARILDVGCGGGAWLLSMRRVGYENLCGQDIHGHCRDLLDHQEIQFFQGPLEDCPFSDVKFDLIRMEHVFEHVPDPLDTLVLIRRLLKSDGLLVLSVPNIASLSFTYTKGHWHALELPLHLYQYTPKSLEYLASRANFRLLRIQHLPVWQQMVYSWSNMTESPFLRQILRTPVAQLGSPLWAFIIRIIRRGDFIVAVMQPE